MRSGVLTSNDTGGAAQAGAAQRLKAELLQAINSDILLLWERQKIQSQNPRTA